MIKTAYKLNNTGLVIDIPEIVKVEIDDMEGVSWREAKKQLRQFYLDKAAALHQVSEKDYFAGAD